MKHYFLFILSACFFTTAFAQPNISGLWQGKLNAGVELTLIFHFNMDGNKNYSCTIDCPEQGLKDFKASSVLLEGNNVTVEVNQIQGTYKTKLLNDSTMEGTWTQAGNDIPLNIIRIKSIAPPKRPQTPQPPFPYKSEDVIYNNEDHSIQYGATITIPEGKGPFPAALLITGSGQQTRDEEIFGHKPFAVIADYLTRKGFIVLRVDDRGMGKTTGEVMKATSRDFANDALVSLNYLKSRKEVNIKKTGLIGHSEGGMIAEMIAAERKDIDFIIMLAGPGEKITELMKHQNEAVVSSTGLPKDYVAAYISLYSKLAETVPYGSHEEAIKNAGNILNEWMGKTRSEIVLATTGIKDDASKQNFISTFVNRLNSPWFSYFMSYDPAPDLQKITAKVLALNGDRDIQVISKTNLPAIEAALKKSKSKSYSVKEIKGLNHLFQHCKACTVQEYGQLEETIAPEVLEMMNVWLQENVEK